MRFKLMIISILTIFVLMACSKKEEQKPQTAANPNVHQVVVEEAIQVSGYTYIRAKEGEKDYWMAVTTMDTKPGETLYYGNAMEMKNFESKELKRKFDSIFFVENISKIPPADAGASIKATPQKPNIEKQNITVDKAAGSVTISQLYSGINSYVNQVVTVKGKVVKVNNGIMNKNWVHIQDGTSSGADYDLTVTTNETLNVGQVVTLKGTVSANKDFGYGYSYKVLLEDAKKL
ncbi:MAG: nucleotide-binding protein [Bacteroidetes bacterium]|nr:nucleotide-binding protein [Bacteroidota bacterium]